MRRNTLLAVAISLVGTSTSFAADIDLKGELRALIGDPHVVVDLNRDVIAEQLFRNWQSQLTATYGSPEAATSTLKALPTKDLYAAALAESFDAVQVAVRGIAAPPSTRVHKALGDANSDFGYTPVPPCRLVDTRNAGGALTARAARSFSATSTALISAAGGNAAGCGVPANAASLMLTITAIVPTNVGNLAAYATGTPIPNASALNWLAGQIVANTTVVPATQGTGLNFDLFNNSDGFTQVAVDVVGYFKQALGRPAQVQLLTNSASIPPFGIQFVSSPVCVAGKTAISGNCATGSFNVYVVFHALDAATLNLWNCGYSSQSALTQTVIGSVNCVDTPSKAN